MKVLVSIVFAVLLENFNLFGNAWEAISSTGNYFEFPCGGDNSKIIVIQTVDNKRKYCRGHLIHEKAALIPAHCLEGYRKNESRLEITINSHEITVEYRSISNTFVHPNYNACYGINNFAIVTFDTSFAVDYDIICLPDQEGINAWSVTKCNESNKNYFKNNEKEKCRNMVSHHDYYKPENRHQIIRKIKKQRRMNVYEVAYSQLITCDFDYKDFYHTFIFASTFYATFDAGNEDEYYMVYRQDYVQKIIPWMVDVITSYFMYK